MTRSTKPIYITQYTEITVSTQFNFVRYSIGSQIFWVVVGLERGPLNLVRSIEELLE